jgi:hypothetical protein
MADVAFILCSLTGLACSILLLRGYRQSRASLLLWSGLCFLGLAANNMLLYLDMKVSAVNLSIIRTIPAVAGICCLLYGMIVKDRK